MTRSASSSQPEFNQSEHDISTLLKLSRELKSIAQNGLHYSSQNGNQNVYEQERYTRILQIASELLSVTAAVGEVDQLEWLREQGHCTPKVDVRGAVIQGDRILLVHEASSGFWTMPGGWADLNLTAAENVEKEVWEESGYLVKATHLIAVFDRDRHPHIPHADHIYKLFFLCDLIGGEPRGSNETLGVGFFPRHDLPELCRSRVTPAQIELAFEFAANPTRPTAFDLTTISPDSHARSNP